MATFSERMRVLRKEKSISLEKLADILGTTKATLSRYENNMREPKAEFVQQLADYFGVSTDYILGLTDVKKPADEIANAIKSDPELMEFWNALRAREDLRLFFKQTRKLSPKAIKQIVKIIKIIEDEESASAE
ncbi:MAG: helix-turn-helix transcriptional regulator [Clostridiales bacterium]|nr:helix-turn-helix transcriptional regulator [Clostridiales bacterium]